MRSRIVVLAFVAAVGPLVGASPSAAQTVNEDASTAMARARFKEGVAFYDRGEFEQARAEFLQAYALKKHPAVLLNLAWSCLRSGHALEAERYFRQFIADGREITPKQRADADDGLAQARAKLGRIEIVAPEGTDVAIDGERVGRTPLADAATVEPGTHAVVLKAPDGTTQGRSVSVLGGESVIARFAASTVTAPTPATSTSTEPSAPAGAPNNSALGNGGGSTAAGPSQEGDRDALEATHGPIGTGHGRPNVAILLVGGVITLAGAGVALGMYVAKNSALDKANSLGNEIVAYSRTNNVDPKNCTSAAPAVLTQACQTWNEDNKAANTDAVVANVAIGVSAAAAGATIIYWIVAANQPASSTASLPALAPMLGRSMGGLTFTAPF